MTVKSGVKHLHEDAWYFPFPPSPFRPDGDSTCLSNFLLFILLLLPYIPANNLPNRTWITEGSKGCSLLKNSFYVLFNLRANPFTITMTIYKRSFNQCPMMVHILANLECFQVFEGSCSCSIVCIKIKVRGSKVCVNSTRIIHAHSFRTLVHGWGRDFKPATR